MLEVINQFVSTNKNIKGTVPTTACLALKCQKKEGNYHAQPI